MTADNGHSDRSALLIDNNGADHFTLFNKQQPHRRKRMLIVIIVVIVTLLLIAILVTWATDVWPFQSNNSGSSSSGRYTMTDSDVRELRQQIMQAFDDSTENSPNNDGNDAKPLLPSTVRLAFHDCGGPLPSQFSDAFPFLSSIDEGGGEGTGSICDGCIDFSNAANHAGLEGNAVVQILDPLYYEHGWDRKISVADFFVAVGTVAVEYAASLSQTQSGRVSPMTYYFGRAECLSTPNTDEGDATAFPNPNGGWSETLAWFATHFAFTERETIAILGAHTLGRGHRTDSGFDGKWVQFSEALDNEFYIDLMNADKQWTQTFVPSVEDPAVGRWQWQNEDGFAEQFMMLNADMSLYIRIDQDFVDYDSGQVNCTFADVETEADNACPLQSNSTVDILMEYANDNQQWLDDFLIAFYKMILSGYNEDDLQKLVFVDAE